MSKLPNDQLRASDAERLTVEGQLSDACGTGRLTLEEELDERLDRARAAPTPCVRR